MAMPTKNIAASITAITPSFRDGERLRICLSKSSWSYRFIFAVPIFVHRKLSKTAVVSLTVAEQILGSVAVSKRRRSFVCPVEAMKTHNRGLAVRVRPIQSSDFMSFQSSKVSLKHGIRLELAIDDGECYAHQRLRLPGE
jgi:hypothetical protein